MVSGLLTFKDCVCGKQTSIEYGMNDVTKR